MRPEFTEVCEMRLRIGSPLGLPLSESLSWTEKDEPICMVFVVRAISYTQQVGDIH